MSEKQGLSNFIFIIHKTSFSDNSVQNISVIGNSYSPFKKNEIELKELEDFYENLCCEISKTKFKTYPDLFKSFAHYPELLLYYKQLFRNRNFRQYNFLLKRTYSLFFKVLKPHIRKYYKIESNEMELSIMWESLMDEWLYQIDSNNTPKNMQKLSDSIMEDLFKFKTQLAI